MQMTTLGLSGSYISLVYLYCASYTTVGIFKLKNATVLTSIIHSCHCCNIT